uniref:Uncharacterized protein n=2 Tax=Panagrolaimus sp. JU765 TaxID=591449 RepID=A0AC34RSG5_9BILA
MSASAADAEALLKEAELERQREAIGEMRSATQRRRNSKKSLKEKENLTPETEKKLSTNEVENNEIDNASVLSLDGSTPEILARDNILDNGSADSTDSAGSPNPSPNVEEIQGEALKGGEEQPEDVTNTVDIENSKEYEGAADDELSIGGDSINTVKHVENMPTRNVQENQTSVALQMFEENQREMMRKTKEEAQQQATQVSTYTLPSVLSYQQYNQPKKTKAESDSDSDADIFAKDNCNQCQTIKRDTKQKTKVCTLM